MRLKVYRGTGMADAMAKLRAELGAEALILNARQVAGGVEITAALEPESEPEPEMFDPGRVAALTWHNVPPDIHPALASGDPVQAVARALTFAALPLSAHDPPVMLAGPPGAGKTLSVVRLATRLVMAGTVPMVITTDGKRAGAIEQLAAFTRILGVQLLVAGHPVNLARALATRRDGAPVLIDTAGFNPYARPEAEEFAELAAAADAHVALVLPASLDPAEAADLAIAHRACAAASMIATRLDLARRLGGVIAAAARARLPLTEAGIGTGAADGMIPLTPSYLATRLIRSEGPNHAS